MKNKMNLKIQSLSENERFARTVCGAFILPLDPTFEDVAEIKTAISEAVTNSIEHGYDGLLTEESTVVVRASITSKEDDIIKVEIEDLGIGIDDIELATTPAYTSKPELEHAGMGFTIMETFMDEVFVNSKKNEGTIITLIKRIRKKKSKLV